MPRKFNAKLREDLAARRLAIITENPLATHIADKLAIEFKIPLHSVWHYLRQDVNNDSRKRYTKEERAYLLTLNRKQLLAFAEKSGKSFDALYAYVWRERQRPDSRTEDEARRLAVDRGFLNFTSPLDLRSHGFVWADLRRTKKALQEERGLDLLPPNYLVHPATLKAYALSLEEQVSILTSPKAFLRTRAEHISKNWKSYEESDHFFILLDVTHANTKCGGKVLGTYSTFERAASAMTREMNGPKPKPMRIERKFGTEKDRPSEGEYLIRDAYSIRIDGMILDHPPLAELNASLRAAEEEEADSTPAPEATPAKLAFALPSEADVVDLSPLEILALSHIEHETEAERGFIRVWHPRSSKGAMLFSPEHEAWAVNPRDPALRRGFKGDVMKFLQWIATPGSEEALKV